MDSGQVAMRTFPAEPVAGSISTRVCWHRFWVEADDNDLAGKRAQFHVQSSWDLAKRGLLLIGAGSFATVFLRFGFPWPLVAVVSGLLGAVGVAVFLAGWLDHEGSLSFCLDRAGQKLTIQAKAREFVHTFDLQQLKAVQVCAKGTEGTFEPIEGKGMTYAFYLNYEASQLIVIVDGPMPEPKNTAEGAEPTSSLVFEPLADTSAYRVVLLDTGATDHVQATAQALAEFAGCPLAHSSIPGEGQAKDQAETE